MIEEYIYSLNAYGKTHYFKKYSDIENWLNLNEIKLENYQDYVDKKIHKEYILTIFEPYRTDYHFTNPVSCYSRYLQLKKSDVYCIVTAIGDNYKVTILS